MVEDRSFDVRGGFDPITRVVPVGHILSPPPTTRRFARRTFYEWRKKGRAPRCIKLPNGDLRIRRAEFERWLDTREENV